MAIASNLCIYSHAVTVSRTAFVEWNNSLRQRVLSDANGGKYPLCGLLSVKICNHIKDEY